MYTKTDITGSLILNHVQRTQIGTWSQSKIDQNLAFANGLDIATTAIALFEDIASKTGVDISGLDATNTNRINGALLYYIAGEMKRRDIDQLPNEKCSEDDYKERAFYYSEACTLLKQINTSFPVYADFCSDTEKDELPDDLFTTEIYYCGCQE